jgi:hypothetical protein
MVDIVALFFDPGLNLKPTGGALIDDASHDACIAQNRPAFLAKYQALCKLIGSERRNSRLTYLNVQGDRK